MNYSKTLEGQKAKDMLNYLKSDLSMELTDTKGNSVASPPVTTQPQVAVPQNQGDAPAGQLGQPAPQKPSTPKTNTNGPPKRPPNTTSGFES